MAPRTIFLAKLLGLYLMAVSLSLFVHAQGTVDIMQSPPLLFLTGLMGVTAGLAIVLAHNVWSGGALAIIVTLCGWASLTKGLLMLILPTELESRIFLAGLHYDQYPHLYAAIALVFGAYLTYAGFRAARTSQVKP